MFGPTPLRDIFLTAGFELREMLRSRFAFFVIMLYMLLGAASSYLFVKFLANIEGIIANPVAMMRVRSGGGNIGPFGGPDRRLRQQLPPPPPPNPAGPSQDMLFGPISPFRGALRGMLDDDDAVEFLAAKPAMTLFNTFAALLMVPILVMLTTSESIAQDIQSRRVRFIALRTGRAEYAVGKILGQGLLIALVVLLSGAMSMAVGAWKLRDFSFTPAMYATLLFWPRIVAFCAPFLGMAALCSMNASSVASSRVFALMSLVVSWVMHYYALLYANSSLAKPLMVVDFLLPYSRQADLWYAAPARYGGAMVILVGLGALYTVIGLAFYRKRDL